MLAEKRVQEGCVCDRVIVAVLSTSVCSGRAADTYIGVRVEIYAEQGFDKIRHNAQLFDRYVNCVWLVPA